MRYACTGLDPDDKHMLTELLAASLRHEEETDEEEMRFRVDVFKGWLDRGVALSEKQKLWLRDTYERIVGAPQYENLVSAGKVPRGKEVEINVGPKVLRPPQRRT